MKIAEAGSTTFCLATLFKKTRKWPRAAFLLCGHGDVNENVLYRLGSTNLLVRFASARLVAAPGSWPPLGLMDGAAAMTNRHGRNGAASGKEREDRERNQKGYRFRPQQSQTDNSKVARDFRVITLKSRETLGLQL